MKIQHVILLAIMIGPSLFSLENEKFSIVKMKKLLGFIVNKVQTVHIATVKKTPKNFTNAIKKAHRQITKPLSPKNFYFIARELLSSLHDGHTYMLVKEEALEKFYYSVDLPFVWLTNDMIVKANTNLVKRGDKILSIGGITPKKLLLQLRKVISAENDFYIKDQGEKLLTRDDFLSYFHLVKEQKVVVKLERNGKIFTIKMPLKPYKKSPSTKHWVRYKIEPENNLGILYLDKCRYKEEYLKKLSKFMDKVISLNLKKVVVDLRNNDGGDSRVSNAFFKYLNKDFQSFGASMRTSKDLLDKIPIFRSDIYRQLMKSFGVNIDKPYYFIPRAALKAGTNLGVPNATNKFNGTFYLLTSKTTFSSAQLFAVQVLDNDLGVIVGEQTGNEINCPGQQVIIDLPDTNFRLSLSASHFVRPDAKRQNENTLTPHHIIATTRQDIIEGKEDLLNWIRKQ